VLEKFAFPVGFVCADQFDFQIAQIVEAFAIGVHTSKRRSGVSQTAQFV
jgi:hypothetical protein